MKKTVTTFLALAMMTAAGTAMAQVKISQVYGGGGGSTGTYLRDYVELFNASGSPVNIGGWALEYGSATGNWGSSAGNIFVFPANTIIQPCKYLLIEAGAAGTAGVALPVTPDFSTPSTGFSMSATNGKVALFNATNANLPCGSELPGTLVDKVAYGTGNCPEGTSTAALTSTSGAVRNGGGLNDTNNNSADFTIVAIPVPRNAASPANAACLATPTLNRTWGAIKSIYR